MKSSPPFPSLTDERRNLLIDVIRGLSILMVVLSHVHVLNPFCTPSEVFVLGRRLDEIFIGMGYYGVVVFFVISGYLITRGTLQRHGCLSQIRCAHFWWLRFTRIVPVLTLCVVILVLFHYFSVGQFRFKSDEQLWLKVSAVFSFQFYEQMGREPVFLAWNPLWSLSVEEMFYLVFPLLCLVLDGVAAGLWVFVALIAGGLYLRLSGQAHVFSFLGCMPFLAIGCLLAQLRLHRLVLRLGAGLAGRLLSSSLLVAGLGLIGWMVLRYNSINPGHFSSLGCAAGAGLVLMSSECLQVSVRVRALLLPMSFLGVISYELYLLHMPVQLLLSDLYGWHSFQPLCLSVLLSLVLHEYAAEPLMRRLRRLHPAMSGGRTGGGARLRDDSVSSTADQRVPLEVLPR